MNTRFRVSVLTCLMTAVGFAQAAKKPIRFAGHVESVNKDAKSATIEHGDIPGFMGAMTMDYAFDDEATLKKVSAGDDILATVYEGDPVLHKVRVVAHHRVKPAPADRSTANTAK